MTRRRSLPIHIVMMPSRFPSASVIRFSRTKWIGTRNRNALLPEPKGLISGPATMLRVID
jgi:hypothetical protein